MNLPKKDVKIANSLIKLIPTILLGLCDNSVYIYQKIDGLQMKEGYLFCRKHHRLTERTSILYNWSKSSHKFP